MTVQNTKGTTARWFGVGATASGITFGNTTRRADTFNNADLFCPKVVPIACMNFGEGFDLVNGVVVFNCAVDDSKVGNWACGEINALQSDTRDDFTNLVSLWGRILKILVLSM